ncbi:MAG TPA: Rrf2 family transcriptional regulator [Candidatus Polarisedimenticolaceae bacterium]|nr:Rrf2 family transcriptional regulator [Candidatus Polarisedimenticolaceae bacterium]
MSFTLLQTTDYAIRAVMHLASLPDGVVALRIDIAQSQGIPASFMAKILRKLVQANLLTSSRGLHGGFRLARPATEIHMLDVVQAVEGRIEVAPCAPDLEGCPHACGCPAALVWSRVQEEVEHTLRAISVEDLVSARRSGGRIARLPRFDVLDRDRAACTAC